MNIPRLRIAFLLILVLPAVLLCQTAMVKTALPVGGGADTKEVPKLEHFDANLVDKTLDPCNDFYKYSCNKWLTANPIPADQSRWGRFNELAEYNRQILHEILEKDAVNDPKRDALTPARRTLLHPASTILLCPPRTHRSIIIITGKKAGEEAR